MTTVFPGAIDSFINPLSSDSLGSATVPHAAQHDNLNDAMLQVQTYINKNFGAGATVVLLVIPTATPTTAGSLGYGSGHINVGDGSANHVLVDLDSAQAITGQKTLTAALFTGTNGTAAGSGAGAGVTYTLTGGQGGATGAGAPLVLTAGAGGASSGAGGAASLTGGAGTAGNSAGGNVSAVGGVSAGTATSGTATLQAGNSSTTASSVVGTTSVLGGNGGAGSGAAGGTVAITGGNADGNGGGGPVNVLGGTGGGTGLGGAINIQGGPPGTTANPQSAGSVTLQGAAGVSSGQHGGKILLVTGAKSGTGLKPLVDLDARGDVPTSAVLTSGSVGFKYNSGGGTLVAYVNDGGSIKSLSLGTPA